MLIRTFIVRRSLSHNPGAIFMDEENNVLAIIRTIATVGSFIVNVLRAARERRRNRRD